MSSVSIAVFGINGALGDAVLTSLQSEPFASKIKYPIKAVTRGDTKSTDKVEYVKSDLSNADELATKLKGTDVFIELLAPNPTLFATTEKVAALVKPKLFIPSQFGVDIEHVQLYLPGFLQLKADHSNALRKEGIQTVDVYTAFFAIPGSFLYEITQHVGVDPQSNTYTVRGDVNQQIAVSRPEDIGNSVASLATIGDYSKIPEKVRILSENVSVKRILETYGKNHNVTLKEGEVISKEQALDDLKKEWSKGFDPSKFLFYLHSIASQGTDKGLSFSVNHRELVNPSESLWKWGKF